MLGTSQQPADRGRARGAPTSNFSILDKQWPIFLAKFVFVKNPNDLAFLLIYKPGGRHAVLGLGAHHPLEDGRGEAYVFKTFF